MKYADLAKINVNEHTEKKANLTYLSWAWAVDQLLTHDPQATWAYGEPVKFGETMMVFCEVSAFGKRMTAQLPVMDHRNKAIPNPDAMQVNTAMQRCLAKAIALHGIGLYIYAGEDLPQGEEKPMKESGKSVGAAELEKLPSEAREALTAHAAEVFNLFNAGDDITAYETYCAHRDALQDPGEQAALRSLLPSNIKTAFTKTYNARKAA